MRGWHEAGANVTAALATGNPRVEIAAVPARLDLGEHAPGVLVVAVLADPDVVLDQRGVRVTGHVQPRGEDVRDAYLVLLKLLHPFAPHITEEMWAMLGGEGFILTSAWPVADPELMKEDIATIVIQVNGKLRGQVEVPSPPSEEQVFAAVDANENVRKWLAGKELVKRVYIPGKLVNLVIR